MRLCDFAEVRALGQPVAQQAVDRQQHASAAVTGLGVRLDADARLQGLNVIGVGGRDRDERLLVRGASLMYEPAKMRNRTIAYRASEISGMRMRQGAVRFPAGG